MTTVKDFDAQVTAYGDLILVGNDQQTNTGLGKLEPCLLKIPEVEGT